MSSSEICVGIVSLVCCEPGLSLDCHPASGQVSQMTVFTWDGGGRPPCPPPPRLQVPPSRRSTDKGHRDTAFPQSCEVHYKLTMELSAAANST